MNQEKTMELEKKAREKAQEFAVKLKHLSEQYGIPLLGVFVKDLGDDKNFLSGVVCNINEQPIRVIKALLEANLELADKLEAEIKNQLLDK